MTFWKPDAVKGYRDTIARATDAQRPTTVRDLDAVEQGFRRAWADGAHELAIWQYHDGRGYMPSTRLWRTVRGIIDQAEGHPPELVARARSLHALLASAADCDVHERAVANDARIVARWREQLPVRPTPPMCAWTDTPNKRRSR